MKKFLLLCAFVLLISIIVLKNTEHSKTLASYPCPKGWALQGTVCTDGINSIDLQGKTLPLLWKAARDAKLEQWEGIACPPGYSKGIGSSANHCVADNPNRPCNVINFQNIDFDNPHNVISFMGNCGITEWPGVTCPVGWNGNGHTAFPCIKPVNSKSTQCASPETFIQPNMNSFDAITAWAKACHLTEPFYGAGLA